MSGVRVTGCGVRVASSLVWDFELDKGLEYLDFHYM